MADQEYDGSQAGHREHLLTRPVEPLQDAYEAGRMSVRLELTQAINRFNDDDSLGIGQLIEVISPWLLND
jgi:hypothetical protein